VGWKMTIKNVQFYIVSLEFLRFSQPRPTCKIKLSNHVPATADLNFYQDQWM
jgi:hypothetical protein